MITESLSFSSSSFYRFATLFFICFFSSRALSFDRISDLLYFFFTFINSKPQSTGPHCARATRFTHFCAFLFATDAPIFLLFQRADSFNRLRLEHEARSEGRIDDEIEIGYYIMLSRPKAHIRPERKKKAKAKIRLDLEKIFSAWRFFFFLLLFDAKAIRDENGEK